LRFDAWGCVRRTAAGGRHGSVSVMLVPCVSVGLPRRLHRQHLSPSYGTFSTRRELRLYARRRFPRIRCCRYESNRDTDAETESCFVFLQLPPAAVRGGSASLHPRREDQDVALQLKHGIPDSSLYFREDCQVVRFDIQRNEG